jgi:selenocysteine-specific elongation factor
MSKEDSGTSSSPPPAEEVLNVNVGVLGHVDSGKTSLVKTLSTLLSTASLDKSKESRQRGMTLDLGFSCFFLEMPKHLHELYPEKKKLQMTLVDCPGHASLIRTIIGGAQIIDMVLLVVDAFKGWQAQTTECLVLAELTSPHLVVALNKIDMFPEHEREKKLEEAKKMVQERLKGSKFRNAPMIGVSACIGGERVASGMHLASNPTYNIETLVQTLQDSLPAPKRIVAKGAPFYFSIDHCFPIKGMGTVMTGTVLSGSISVNDHIEFPTLGLERKVKSMQMFKRKTLKISQGDRAGMCVSSLDSNLLERGVAATPGAVQLLKGAIALVRKIPYYQHSIADKSKVHISVGHTTIMATVTFWGAKELHEQQRSASASDAQQESIDGHSTLGGDADLAGLPYLKYDWDQDFIHQDGMLETLSADPNKKPKKRQSPLHWAMLDFQTPVYCPLHSLVIGSRLDLNDQNSNNKSSTAAGELSASSCRLAFCGRLIEKVEPAKDYTRIRSYAPKERIGVISRLGDPHKRQDDGKTVRYEIFGSDLFKKETILKPFFGMKVITPQGDVGELKSAFGTSGKFKAIFPAGTEAREGDTLVMPFMRFAHDPEKKMRQTLVLPASRPGARMETKKKKAKPEAVGLVEKLKGDVLENGKHNIAIIAGFFTPEVDVRERIGRIVFIPSTQEEGTIAGAFGKAGKCKVAFENGISAEAGAKAELSAV